jgi:signal transduction histidine kinase
MMNEGQRWRRPEHRWRGGRARFVRRAGCAIALLLVLSGIGVATLMSWLIGRTSLAGSPPLWMTVLAGALGPALLAAVFVLVMRRIGSPFADIVDAADRVATGDFSARVVERGPPPLRAVARAFNSMTSRLQAQEVQRRHLMADVAHELRTPLTVMQGRLEGLVDGIYARDSESLSMVLDETRTLARLVEDLRTLANAEAGSLVLHREPSDLAIVVQEAAGSVSAEAAAAGVTVRTDVGDLPLVEADPVRIREVLVNLLSNALRHTPRGAAVVVTAAHEDDRLRVTVSNAGSGIPAEELPRIFDRFYKGSQSRGSGLGLTIARNLVVAHGGAIEARSRPGEGTTISFSLPA